MAEKLIKKTQLQRAEEALDVSSELDPKFDVGFVPVYHPRLTKAFTDEDWNVIVAELQNGTFEQNLNSDGDLVIESNEILATSLLAADSRVSGSSVSIRPNELYAFETVIDLDGQTEWQEEGDLTTRTDDTAGTLTMDIAGHEISTGDRLSIYWGSELENSRRDCVAGTVAGTSIPFTSDGSTSGSPLPSVSTAITVIRYQQHRIPCLMDTPNYTHLTWEARLGGVSASGDTGNNDIGYIRRDKSTGQWGTPQILLGLPSQTYPGAFTDQDNFRDPQFAYDEINGRLHLFFHTNTSNNAVTMTSDDEGATWSAAAAYSPAIPAGYTTWVHSPAPGIQMHNTDRTIVRPYHPTLTAGSVREIGFEYSTGAGATKTWHQFTGIAVPAGSVGNVEPAIIEQDYEGPNGERRFFILSRSNAVAGKITTTIEIIASPTGTPGTDISIISDGVIDPDLPDQKDNDARGVSTGLFRVSLPWEGSSLNIIGYSFPSRSLEEAIESGVATPTNNQRFDGALRFSLDNGATWSFEIDLTQGDLQDLTTGRFGYSHGYTIDGNDIGVIYETGEANSAEDLNFFRLNKSYIFPRLR